VGKTIQQHRKMKTKTYLQAVYYKTDSRRNYRQCVLLKQLVQSPALQ